MPQGATAFFIVEQPHILAIELNRRHRFRFFDKLGGETAGAVLVV